MFSFKQFTIHQDLCGMKVGTDGVLLGAWASGKGLRILDIGTGTGLIALMMAQRFPQSQVTAIDIDTNACQQARENVQASPFFERIRVIESKIQDFKEGSYDTIVSNPPFFMDSLKNPDAARLTARHTDELPYQDLFISVKRLLTETGEFSAIIPSDYLERFITVSCISGFFISRRYGIRTVPKKAIKRYLLTFTKRQAEKTDYQEVTLMDKEGKRSEWYQKLTDNFYIR